MKRIDCIILCAVIAIFSSCEKDNTGKKSLDGVWESSMKISDDKVSVNVIEIKGSTLNYYEMEHNGSNYVFDNPKTGTIEKQKTKKNEPVEFNVTIDGQTLPFFKDGNVLCSTEKGELYYLTSCEISHYYEVSNPAGLIPTDKEYAGPTSYAPTLLQTQLNASIDWLGLLEWATKTAATTAMGKGVGALIDELFPSGGTSLDVVLDKLNVISSQLDQMILLYHNNTYESKLNERSKYVGDISNYNEDYYIMLSNAKTEDDLRTIITKWASETVSGNPAYKLGEDYMSFLLTTIIEQRDIYNMYDLYTYNTHPWECMGYEVREGLRASDIAVASQCLFLTQLYQMLRTDIDETSRQSILEKNAKNFDDFAKYIKERPVERHDLMAICQIPNAHFAMDVKFDCPDYHNPYWCSLPCRWTRYESDDYFMWGPDQSSNYAMAIRPSEMEAILNYYGGSKSLYQILNDDAQCVISDFPALGLYGTICLQSGHYSDDWRYVGLDKVVFTTAKYASDIAGRAPGKAVIDGAGIFSQYLEFYRWSDYYEDRVWIRTRVRERE